MDRARPAGSKQQRQVDTRGQSTGQHHIAALCQKVVSFLDGTLPNRPRRRIWPLLGAPVANEERAIGGVSSSVQCLRNEPQLRRRAAEPVDQEYADTPPRQQQRPVFYFQFLLHIDCSAIGTFCVGLINPTRDVLVPQGARSSASRRENEQRVQQLERQVHFLSSYVEARSQRHHVLAVAADIQHAAVAAPTNFDVALQALFDHPIDDGLGRRIAVMRRADLHTQRQTESIDMCGRLVPPLQILETFEEVGALLHDHGLVIGLCDHAQELKGDAGPNRIGIECRMGGARWEYRRVDQFLAGPDASQRIEAVCNGLSEHENVRLYTEMLNRPEFASSIEAHLDRVADQQNAVFVENLLQLSEAVRRRDDVAACALNRLDVEGRDLGLTRLRIPNAIIFAFEQPGELSYAVAAVLLLAHALWTAEVVREWQEVGPLAEMAIAAAITIG